MPLFVGFWFPLTVVPAVNLEVYFLAGPYSAITFALLGFVVNKAGSAVKAVAVADTIVE